VIARPLPDAPVLVGFSGGLDSTVLLHALAAEPAVRARGLRSLHVDHGLHVRSLDWAEHCLRVCAALGVELATARMRVFDDGCGPEAAARAARYAAFAQALRPGEWLALAHHADDQAETVLLRLLRASASGGVASMRAQRPFAAGVLWRPLLDVPRATLEAYASAHSLHWIDDPSNADTDLDRNHLRHRVLPALRERWPHAATVLARSANLLAGDAALLADEAARRLAAMQGLDPAIVSVPALQALSPPWRARVVRHWIESLGLPPLPASGVDALEHELLPAAHDAEPCFAWAGVELRRWRDVLRAGAPLAALPADWNARWDGAEPLPLPTGERLAWLPGEGGDDARAAGPLRVRARLGGERIRLAGRAHSHAVKKLLHALAVPAWERPRLPLVYAADGELLAVGDVLLSARLEADGARLRLL
jgi:tRNA(Ile)-lysidine synthase